VDREPGVLGVLGSSHLDGELQLVGERGRGAQRVAGLGLGGLAFPQQLGEGFELAPEVVEALDRLDLFLEAAGLPEDLLGLFGLRPEIGGGGLLPQLRERAPRGVLIKGSPEAPRGAPRRPTRR
jgi:hypothetical protein